MECLSRQAKTLRPRPTAIYPQAHKPTRQRVAMVAISDDGGPMVVSRDILSPMRLSGGLNKSIPRMESTKIEYPLKLKLDIKHNVNAKHLQCQCIVSGPSYGPSPYRLILSLILYIFFLSGPQFKKTGLENLEQSLYHPGIFSLPFHRGNGGRSYHAPGNGGTCRLDVLKQTPPQRPKNQNHLAGHQAAVTVDKAKP